MINRLYSKKVRQLLLAIQLLLLYLPTLKLFAVPTDNGEIPASLCYFFALATVPYLLGNFRHLKWPPWYLTGFFAFVLLWAVICAPSYGLSKSILHWGFGFFLLVMIPTVGHDFSREDWLSLLEGGACCFFCIHFVYMIIHRQYLLDMLKGYWDGSGNGSYAALIPSLTRGGRNLDASWLALGAFFVRGRKKAVYVSYVLLFSFVASSRVGIIAIGMVILWSLIYDPDYRLSLKNLKWYILYAALMLMVVVGTGSAQGLFSRLGIHLPSPAQMFGIVSRQEAQQAAAELPSTSFLSGRESLWTLAPEAFKDRPLGYGVGNAVRVLRMYYGFNSFEDVMHNVFLQLLLDEGILGALWFVGMCIAFLISQCRKGTRPFAAPIAGYFLTYLVLSVAQFHGGEALMQFVLAVYLAKTQLLLGEKANIPAVQEMPEPEMQPEKEASSTGR